MTPPETPAAAPEPAALAVRPAASLPALTAELIRQTGEQLLLMRQFVRDQMVDGTDFGLIPGTGQKKVLLLPGAQKVAMLYNCCPEYEVKTAELPNGHAEFQVRAELVYRGSGAVVGTGVGSCSTMESKYRYRTTDRKCPNCEKECIKRSKYPDRDAPRDPPGWYCFAKIGGCGANYRHDDPAIAGQSAGKADNPDIADVRNTCLKMAVKRALVAAALGLGCLTELFTQDLEEHGGNHDDREEATPPVASAKDVAAVRAKIEELKATGFDFNMPGFLRFCGVAALEQLPAAKVKAVLTDLQHKIEGGE